MKKRIWAAVFTVIMLTTGCTIRMESPAEENRPSSVIEMPSSSAPEDEPESSSPSSEVEASNSSESNSSSVVINNQEDPNTYSSSDSTESDSTDAVLNQDITPELMALFTEKINKIAPSNIFASNFDDSNSDEDGYYLYTAGCYILGDNLESTYQYAVRTLQNQNFYDYPFTPARIMDQALQEYFKIPSDNLHDMIENYDPEIDGYWAPMGGGGISSTTTIIDCNIKNGIAILSCETRTAASSENDPATSSTVTLEYSEEYGWRFLSCSVL
ncbi:hypothetical protein [Merdimmobilis hominis]|uniref:hypothetical protein n=1 Tax=Merdimmobilis hominis TaxID=2897707 RepID=UPI0011602807|nr:hypothetical protein [Merdimmobilis hominis]